MKKVAVIANVPIHQHYIGPLIKSLDAHDIYLIAHPRLLETLAPLLASRANISAIIPTDGNRVFSAEVLAVLRSVDFVFFEEPFSFREMADMAFKTISVPFTLTVHNLNSWFFPHYGPRIKQTAVTVMKRLILRKTPDVIVVGSNVLSHTQSLNIDKNILYVPLYYNEGKTFRTFNTGKTSDIRIVIPGGVSRRRNYTRLLDVFERVKPGNMVLVLLGAPTDDYGRNIIERSKAMIADGYRIEYYESFIPGEKYEAEVDRADVLLSLFDVNYRTIDRQDEIYGKTKITGAAILALNRAKPIIVPADYTPLHEIASQVLPFETNDDLLGILHSIAENRGFLTHYTENAVRNAEQMSLTDTRRALNDLITKRTG